MRLAIISSRFPRANNEPFLGMELEKLRPRVAHVSVFPVRPPFAHGTLALAAAAALRAPRAVFAALVDVVLRSGSWRAAVKNLVVFARSLALAQLAHRERIEHVHAYWLSTPATAAYVIAKVNGIPWSATAHRWDIFEQNMTRQKVASARFIRAISERGRAELCRQVPQYARKISVVRLGTALAARAASHKERPELRLLCAAAFRPVKGHRVLLDAFSRAHAVLPELRLTLCGEGPREPEIHSRAARLPCRDAVQFRGYVAHAQLLAELAAGHYDAVVLASIDDGAHLMEGVPSILIEAASLGVPCIATRSGAIAELLDDDCAFLARCGDAESLSTAILAAADAAQRSARSKRAMTRAREQHDPRRCMDHLVDLLEESA